MKENKDWKDEVRYYLRRANPFSCEDYEGQEIARKLEDEFDFHTITFIKIETIRFNKHEIVIKIKQFNDDYHVMPDVVKINTDEFLKVFNITK